MREKEHYLIRKASKDEVEKIVLDWAAKEGWNPGLHDGSTFYNTDPLGFFIGFLDNEPISCISVVTYDSSFAFLGFYIVQPDYRGKGYGLKIWNFAIANLQTHNIGLDGVVEQQSSYKKSGFKLAYKNIRYEGIAQSNKESFPEIVPISKVDFDDLSRYDSSLFPSSRPQFLQSWIHQPDGLAIAAVDDGKIAGYGVIRKCRIGYKIGPLFSDTSDLAKKLFLTMHGVVEPGTRIYIDTPEVNQSAVQLAEQHGMKKVFETARMYTGSPPDINLDKIYGVTTFELG